MKGFAKIIELEEHDVVIIRGSSDEDGEHIDMIASLDGMTAKQVYGFEDDEAQAIKAFGMLGEKQATSFIEGLKSMMD